MEAARITLSWLQSSLSKRFPELQITHFHLEDIGAGTSYGATVLRATLTRTPNYLPASLIIKLPVTDAQTLRNLETTGILLREALFYRDLANNKGLDIPDIYHVSIHNNDFEIIMEDLGNDQRKTLGNLSIDQINRALVSVAKLHATYWNHNILGQTWLKPISDGSRESRSENLASISRAIDILRTNRHDAIYTLDCACRLQRLIPDSPTIVPLPKPITLVHGDFHSNNLYFSDNRVVFFDWQLTGKGTPMMDVANLLVSSCEPKVHIENMGNFLTTYHRALVKEGISSYSIDSIRLGYRLALFFTFLKFLIVLGTIKLDNDDNEAFIDIVIPKLESCARAANAKLYCRLMPLMFLAIKFVNLCHGIFEHLRRP